MKNNKYEGYTLNLPFNPEKQAGVFKEYFRRSRNYPQFNQFMPIHIESSAQGFSIRFGISHHFKPEHCCDTIDGVSSFQFFSGSPRKKEELHSFLELQCTRKEEDWVLNLVCNMHTDFIDYNIEGSGLVTFLKSQMHFDMVLNQGKVYLGNLSLATKTVIINDITLNDLQFNNVLNEILNHEGDEPAYGAWIPVGSMRTLQQSLDWEHQGMAFFPNP
jgi:hypothetical protein